MEVDGDLTGLKKSLDRAHKRVQVTADKMSKVFKVAGIAMVAGISVGLVALTKKVVSLGREFESNMKTVQAWSGATGKALQGLTDIAREMGATTEYTATEAAGALKFLAAAGFTSKQSIAALPGTLDLATAGQVDLASATDITTDTLTAFGMSVKELSRVSDAFVVASSSANTNVLMLGESFKMVAPTAHLFGLSVEQTSAFLGTLANSGIKAEMAGSGLNMVLMKSALAAKKLGLEAGTPLIEVLKKMKEEQWGAVQIGEAFGIRQVKTAAILMNNIDMYEKLTQKIIDNKGATKKLADIVRDSLDIDLKTLNSTIEEELLRTFDKHKDEIREIIQNTTEWIRQNPQVIEQAAELAKNLFELAKVMGQVVNLGVEYVNVWVKSWQAMGLASAGVITWKDALFDGANAVDLFGTEVGILQLRARLLKDEIAEIQSFKDMMRFYAPGEKDRLIAIQKELVNIETNIKSIQLTASKGLRLEKQINQAERLAKALEAPGKFYGKLIAEETIKTQKKDEKLLAEWSEIQQTYWLTDTENQLRELTIQYDNYAKQVEDKLELERWFSAEKLQIQAEMANQSIALYTQLYESTGLEDYAEKAIAEYSKVMDAAEITWGKILTNEEDIAILRLAKEQEFADGLYNIFDDIVNAEQDAANERLRIIDDFTSDRIAKEERQASKATGGFSTGLSTDQSFQMTWGSYIGFLTPAVEAELNRNAARERMIPILEAQKKEQERTNAELQRIAASAARTNQLAQESAQREIQQIYEQRKREVTGQYDRLVDWLVGKQRAEWGMAEWESQFGRVSEYAVGLNPAEAGFYENGLSALESMVDILMQIDRIEEQQLSEQKRLADTLLSSIQTIDDAILSLKVGELAPVTSREFFESTYSDMLAAAIESSENIGVFTSFVEQTFLPFMKSYHAEGEGYTAVFGDVLSSLEMLKGQYGGEWIGQTLKLAGLYEVDVSDLVTYIGMIETYDVDLTDFYNIINQLESQGVNLTDFYNVIGTLKTQTVDLSGFYNLISEFPVTTAQWGQLIDIDFSGLWSSIENAVATGEPLLDTTTTKLNELYSILGNDIPNAAQLIIDKMKTGSTFEQAFRDVASSLGSLEGPLTGVGITSEGTAESATGLTTELARTLAPFDAVSLNLDAMSANVQTKLTETANFFTVLADSLGLTFTGAGGIAAAISALTPAPLAPTVVATVETEASVYNPGTGSYYGWEHPAYIPPGVTTAHGYIIWSDGTKTYYGAGGLTDGPGIAGELGPEYIVPTYEPQNTNFLKSVGADPEKIGMAIAKQLVPLVTQGGKDITINIIVDGQVINSVVKKGLAGEDTDLIEMVRSA